MIGNMLQYFKQMLDTSIHVGAMTLMQNDISTTEKFVLMNSWSYAWPLHWHCQLARSLNGLGNIRMIKICTIVFSYYICFVIMPLFNTNVVF